MSNHPVVSGLTDVAFDENAVNGAGQLINGDVTLVDDDGDFTGGVVTVSGLLAEDVVSIGATGSVYRNGNAIWYDPDGAGGVAAVQIGGASGGVGGTFSVTLNPNATTAAVEALLENLTYRNTSDSPTATRDLTITVRDAAGQSSLGPSGPAAASYSGCSASTSRRISPWPT